MSKFRFGGIIVLTFIVLILIGLNLTDSDTSSKNDFVIDPLEPTYSTQHTLTVVYDPNGKLSYKLMANNIEHYATQQLSQFYYPVLTTFDHNGMPTWSIRASKALLTNKNILSLDGNVEINSLSKLSQLERITTDTAQVDLNTQDVSSDNEVTFYGTNFTSHGLKMRGNMRTKTARLLDKVNTYYEIQNNP